MVAAGPERRGAGVGPVGGFHGPANISPDGKMLTTGYVPDVVNLDISDPTKPRLISIFPTPVPPKKAVYKNFCDKGGRFGPHNTNQEIHNSAVAQPGNLIYIAYFNAGLRIFDISDPRLPKEVGYFMPPERPGLPEHAGAHASPINWSEEVAVDARGNIYLNDDKWGTFVLRYTGKVPEPRKSAAK